MTLFEEHPPVDGRTVAVSRRTLIAAVAAVMILVLAAAGLVAVMLLRAPSATASETSLEPVNTPGPNPFIPTPGGNDAAGLTPPSGASGPVQGSAPGLFGGSVDNSSCDRNQIASFLAAHPDEGAAWADAVGADQTEIGDFLRELSPMILRVDTAVTNHGYEDGQLTSFPAVLQAGTAVLVDGYGTPRVKCNCGNPVAAPPRRLPARYEGARGPVSPRSLSS